ncbi:MAG: NAD(P)-dependent oxidoreductase [Clostridiales bacterium]|nr:NAD(P)-dependent oxidoreductase [Clostridiales bacterium]
MNIAFIGVGVMGRGMVANLLNKGYQVGTYSRRKESAKSVLGLGAVWHDSIKSCVKDADVVISMVGYPKDVEEVYFGNEGILDSAKEGAILIDMTTTSPKLAVRIENEARRRGLKALDAPVSGGDTGAQKGTLAIMAGGDEAAFNQCLPIFEAMGKTIVYQGKAGSGQHTKMANQIAIAGCVAGVAEAITYGKAAGLDLNILLDTISGGAAGSWQLSNNGRKMVEGDYAPGFYIKHFIKDMDIAKEEAQDRHLSLGILEKVLEKYQSLADAGLEDEGTQAIIKKYMTE